MQKGIYAILNITNDKFYVGSAKNFKRRFSEHIRALKRNKHPNIHLQRAYNKQWVNPFIFVTLKECEINNLIEQEQYYIDTLKPEYNLAPKAGSTIGYKVSEETKAKISLANKGKVISKEHRLKISISNKGQLVSPEARVKMSIARKKRITKLETRIKLSKNHFVGNKYRRNLQAWPCEKGRLCNCKICTEKKRIIYNNWHREWRKNRKLNTNA